MNSLQASVNSMVGPGMARSAALQSDNGQVGVMARLAINEAINAPNTSNTDLSVRIKKLKEKAEKGAE